MLYKTSNGVYLEIHPDLIKSIHREMERIGSFETGGLLIGYYSEDNSTAVIDKIIFPPENHFYEPRNFELDPKYSNKIIDEEWKQGRRWIGDWHSHPNNPATPSKMDDNVMFGVANSEKANMPEAILLIVGGNNVTGYDLSLHLYRRDEKLVFNKIV